MRGAGGMAAAAARVQVEVVLFHPGADGAVVRDPLLPGG